MLDVMRKFRILYENMRIQDISVSDQRLDTLKEKSQSGESMSLFEKVEKEILGTHLLNHKLKQGKKVQLNPKQ